MDFCVVATFFMFIIWYKHWNSNSQRQLKPGKHEEISKDVTWNEAAPALVVAMNTVLKKHMEKWSPDFILAFRQMRPISDAIKDSAEFGWDESMTMARYLMVYKIPHITPSLHMAISRARKPRDDWAELNESELAYYVLTDRVPAVGELRAQGVKHTTFRDRSSPLDLGDMTVEEFFGKPSEPETTTAK